MTRKLFGAAACLFPAAVLHAAIINADFSTGDLSGWTAAGQVTVEMFGPTPPAALLREDQGTTDRTNLHQVFEIPPDATEITFVFGVFAERAPPDVVFPPDAFLASLLHPMTQQPLLSSPGFADYFSVEWDRLDEQFRLEWDAAIVSVSDLQDLTSGNILGIGGKVSLKLESLTPEQRSSVQLDFAIPGGNEGLYFAAMVDVVANRPPTCDAGGPYVAACGGNITLVSLNGLDSTDADPGDQIAYEWATDCPFGRFDDSQAATPMLSVTSVPGCVVSCVVSLNVADVQGASDSCEATVSIADVDAPDRPCMAPATVQCDESSDPDAIGYPAALDDCDPEPLLTFVDAVEPGTCPRASIITRTWTATDRCNQTAACDQSINVVDTTPPSITETGTDTYCLWPANHWYVCFDLNSFNPPTVDNCGTFDFRFHGCESDQPDDAKGDDPAGWNGDGDTQNDCVVDRYGQWMCVRAERAGTGPTAINGRRYSVLMVATDECGNSSDPVLVGRVHVPHDQNPRSSCINTTRVGCKNNASSLPCR